jgi:hypothetical protein
MSLTILEHQPSFPDVDLSDKNAAFLEMFLQNQEFIEASHPSAESTQLLYTMAHWTVSETKDVFDDPSIYAGFTHGFTIYEIISSLVAPKPALAEDASVVAATRGLMTALKSSKRVDFLTDAYDELTSIQPVTSEVIAAASARYHTGLTHYAIMGAAIERQLELEAREYSKNIVQ